MKADSTPESEPPANFEFEALHEANNYRCGLLREFSPHLSGDVLEVGAGIGQFTSMLRQLPQVKSIIAVEPDPQFLPAFRAALPDVPLVHGTADDLSAGAQFDGIISVNVMEHIEADEREMRRYFELLRERKGMLCLFVPARPEIYAPIDGDFGHFRRYRKLELRQKLEKAGFRIVRLHYYNFIGYFAWWFNFCILKKRVFEVGAVRFFDRMIFPVGHFLESRVMRPPFGQNLLAVCKADAGEKC